MYAKTIKVRDFTFSDVRSNTNVLLFKKLVTVGLVILASSCTTGGRVSLIDCT